MKKIVAIGIIAVITLTSIYFILANRGSPYIVEIILGSVSLGMLIGLTRAVIQHFVDMWFKKKKILLLCLLVSLTLVAIAGLLYATNRPGVIECTIPITYVIDVNSLQLADMYFEDFFARNAYSDARTVWRESVERLTVTDTSRRLAESIITGGVNQFALAWLHSLTDYLVGFYLYKVPYPTSAESELADYSGQSLSFYCLPHPDIAGETLTLESIHAVLKGNPHSNRVPIVSVPGERSLPKGTTISLRVQKGKSEYTIRNNYVEISINVNLIQHSGGQVFLADSMLPLPFTEVQPRRSRVNGYRVAITCRATFTRWRYGFLRMRHYEDWTKDLFAYLQRAFSWGDPDLLSIAEVLRRQYSDTTPR